MPVKIVTDMPRYKRDFIDFMVSCGVLTFGDFTLKSGRRSPYFLNAGRYDTGRQLSQLGGFYASAVAEHCFDNGKPNFDFLFGPAYKGIPLVTVTASALWTDFHAETAYCFNRKEPKDHGEGGILVGRLPKDGQRGVLIDDVTTAGTVVYEVMPLLRAAADVRVTDMIISADRMEIGKTGRTTVDTIYDEFGIRIRSIVNIGEIIGHLRQTGALDDGLFARMKEYTDQYCV